MLTRLTLSMLLVVNAQPILGRATLALSAPPPPASAPQPATPTPAPPLFQPADRSVTTWRTEAATHLDLTPAAAADLVASREASPVARCVKLNNYWCIKKAGWAGEIAADGEGHVAFASATEGAAVAALLLKRYYVDFNRKSAMAIIARWAPAECGAATARATQIKTLAPKGLRNTLRARWLAGHARGFAKPAGGGKRVAAGPRRSVVPDHHVRMMPAPTIAVGLGEHDRASKPITLDALLQSNPNAPPSRSMIGLPLRAGLGSATCAGQSDRIASYAAKAASGIAVGQDGDLGLFDATGVPTDNLTIIMANMARVEIGPLGVTMALIKAGIAEAFKPGRNPS